MQSTYSVVEECHKPARKTARLLDGKVIGDFGRRFARSDKTNQKQPGVDGRNSVLEPRRQPERERVLLSKSTASTTGQYFSLTTLQNTVPVEVVPCYVDLPMLLSQ